MQMDISFIGVIFYALGSYSNKLNLFVKENSLSYPEVLLAFFVLLLLYKTINMNGGVSIRGPYGWIPLFYFNAVAASWLTILSARAIKSRILSFFGVMSIAIFPSHDAIQRFFYFPKATGLLEWYSNSISHYIKWFKFEYTYLFYQVFSEILISCLLGIALAKFMPLALGGLNLNSIRSSLKSS
jgi:hypothetical protein